MRCPTCNGTFQAPTLAPATNETWVNPPADPAPAPTAKEPPATSAAPETPKKKKDKAPEPVVEGDYSRTYTLTISGRSLLPWVVPVGLGLIVLLSFFPWIEHRHAGAGLVPASHARPMMWSVAFGDEPSGVMTMFVILSIFLAWPLSIVSLLIGLKIVPLPPPLDVIGGFRSIIIAALTVIGVGFFSAYYLTYLFGDAFLGMLAMKVAFRIALVVAAAAVLQFWLERRQLRSLPPPQVTVRW